MKVAGIVSGGQTGVDRAALDVALELGIPCRGWCPAGRWAEDGRVPDRYPLRETPSSEPAERTEWNVRDSDGTLIISQVPLRGGTGFTAACAARLGRPLLVLAPDSGIIDDARGWLSGLGPDPWLNVAGPRESQAPGVYAAARRLLAELIGTANHQA